MRCVYPFNNGEPAWGLGSIDYFCTTSFPFPGFGGRAEKTCLFPRQFSALVFPDNYSSTIPMIFSEVLPAAVLQKTRNVLSKAPALSGIISTLISDFSPGMTGLRFHDGFVHPQEASMWVITSGLSPVFSRTKAACAVLPILKSGTSISGRAIWMSVVGTLSAFFPDIISLYNSQSRGLCVGLPTNRTLLVLSRRKHWQAWFFGKPFSFTVDIKRQFEPVGP